MTQGKKWNQENDTEEGESNWGGGGGEIDFFHVVAVLQRT